ncbi:hypothetical protein HOP50_14g73200 [Chloropicon primus]|uniref:Uncharacterized protein n=1 Tax=Chloropicon primus TaxID=1764295 RepID=A0A5B8MWU6_9CHLO|nr:hypothetical protein A3770_14p72990 [Chloropicon primus]UPR03989.1 hypothetical protein HOP50_14g73200 [Chloropicon primus]|eukprot:QDZ24781.1 hypothetical protein A3770_14p72990 [Chloropicon primus]
MTLLDSKRLVDKADALALKELVKALHRSSASDAMHFKQVLYSSSKAWPVIVERLTTWLKFHLDNKDPSARAERLTDMDMMRGEGLDLQVGTLEQQVCGWKRTPQQTGNRPRASYKTYGEKFRTLKQWPLAFTSKDPAPYHTLRQKKWFKLAKMAASNHVLYKVRYLIHLIYYLVKDSSPIQERLYWLLEPNEEEERGHTGVNGEGKQKRHSCFLNLFVLLCKCLKIQEIGDLSSELEHEVVSILYYVMKFSEEAAESEDRDPLSFLSKCLGMMPRQDVEYLLEKLLKPSQLITNNLTYELYQSFYLASRVIKLRPSYVRSFGQQFEVDWKYEHHKMEGTLDKVVSESFLNQIYTLEYHKIYEQLSGAIAA